MSTHLPLKGTEKPPLPGSETPKKFAFKPLLFTGLVLLVSLGITLFATFFMKSSVEKIANQEFLEQCNKIQM